MTQVAFAGSLNPVQRYNERKALKEINKLRSEFESLTPETVEKQATLYDDSDEFERDFQYKGQAYGYLHIPYNKADKSGDQVIFSHHDTMFDPETRVVGRLADQGIWLSLLDAENPDERTTLEAAFLSPKGMGREFSTNNPKVTNAALKLARQVSEGIGEPNR